MGVKHCCYGVCNSDSRYSHREHMQGVKWIPFPKPTLSYNKCEKWIKACGREDFTIKQVNKYTYMCNKHFVGGNGPTEEFPDPIPALKQSSAELAALSSKKKRNPPVRKTLLAQPSGKRKRCLSFSEATIPSSSGYSCTTEPSNKRHCSVSFSGTTSASTVPHSSDDQDSNEKPETMETVGPAEANNNQGVTGSPQGPSLGTKCFLASCNNRRSASVSLHQFPSQQSVDNIERSWRWMKFCDRTPTEHSRLCSVHFEPKYFISNYEGRRVLSNEAVPTIKVKVVQSEEIEVAEETEVSTTSESNVAAISFPSNDRSANKKSFEVNADCRDPQKLRNLTKKLSEENSQLREKLYWDTAKELANAREKVLSLSRTVAQPEAKLKKTTIVVLD